MPGAELYRERREAGLCSSCGKHPPEEGRTKCAECGEANRERARANGKDSATKPVGDKDPKKIIAHGLRAAHDALREAVERGHLTEAERKYTNWAWRKLREAVLEFHGRQCDRCGSQGRGGGLHCDHITPHGDSAWLFYDFNNLQPLCQKCHASKTLAESGNKAQAKELQRLREEVAELRAKLERGEE